MKYSTKNNNCSKFKRTIDFLKIANLTIQKKIINSTKFSITSNKYKNLSKSLKNAK